MNNTSFKVPVENRYLIAGLGSPGVDELRWKKPVRPGDTLSLRVTVMETKRSLSKPDRGFLNSFIVSNKFFENP